MAAGSYYGDGFLLNLNKSGSKLIYATYIGATGDDYATSVVLAQGALYISGLTNSPNFPITAGAYDTSSDLGVGALCNGGAYDVFILKVKP